MSVRPIVGRAERQRRCVNSRTGDFGPESLIGEPAAHALRRITHVVELADHNLELLRGRIGKGV